MATSSCEALMIWSMSALSFTANRTVVAAWYHPAYGLFLSVPPTNPQAQQTNNGSGGLTSRSLEERPAGVPEAGSPVFQYWIPNRSSPSGLSAHCDHTRPLRVLVTSPLSGFPPTIWSAGPDAAGASAAAANSAVSKPSTENTATAARSTTLFIPNPSFIKVTTTNLMNA